MKLCLTFLQIAASRGTSCTYCFRHEKPLNFLKTIFKTGGGGTWPVNIRGGTAGKSKKLPCPGVKFLKMIPCPGVKFS